MWRRSSPSQSRSAIRQLKRSDRPDNDCLWISTSARSAPSCRWPTCAASPGRRPPEPVAAGPHRADPPAGGGAGGAAPRPQQPQRRADPGRARVAAGVPAGAARARQRRHRHPRPRRTAPRHGADRGPALGGGGGAAGRDRGLPGGASADGLRRQGRHRRAGAGPGAARGGRSRRHRRRGARPRRHGACPRGGCPARRLSGRPPDRGGRNRDAGGPGRAPAGADGCRDQRARGGRRRLRGRRPAAGDGLRGDLHDDGHRHGAGRARPHHPAGLRPGDPGRARLALAPDRRGELFPGPSASSPSGGARCRPRPKIFWGMVPAWRRSSRQRREKRIARLFRHPPRHHRPRSAIHTIRKAARMWQRRVRA